MASNFYRSPDAPRYILGHALELGFISAGILALCAQVWGYKRINGKRREEEEELLMVRRDMRAEDGGEGFVLGGYSKMELSELGDRAVTFRYTL